MQLRDRLVQQAHLLERDAQVIVRLEIGLVDVLVDPLFEARQHVMKVLLFIAGGLLIGDGHPRVFGRRSLLVVTEHRAEVDEVAVQCGFVADLHFRVFGLDLAFRFGRRNGGREHGERGLGALVLGVMLGDARVHGACLVGEV